MPECHSCSKNGLSWLGCLQCKGPSETNHKGQTFVSFDAGRERGQTLGECEAVSSGLFNEDPPREVDTDALDLDTAMNAAAGDYDLDNDGERAALETAERMGVEPAAGCDPQAAAADPVAGLATSDPEHGAEPEPDSPLDLARKLAFVFTELTTEEFDLVRRLMRGENMADIGRTSGITRAAVSMRVRTLARKHPVFLFLRGNAGKSVVWTYQAAPAGCSKTVVKKQDSTG